MSTEEGTDKAQHSTDKGQNRNTVIIINTIALLALGSTLYTFFMSRELDSVSKKNLELERLYKKNVNKLDKQLGDNKFKIYFSCDTDKKENSAEEDSNQSLLKKLRNIGRTSVEDIAGNVKGEDGCPPVKFCEVSNIFNNITFTKKKFETTTISGTYQKGTYLFNGNNIFIMPTETSQRELQITNWDDEHNIIEFMLDGKFYNQTSCKTPDQEKKEQEKIQTIKYEKETAEKEKLRLEKVEKDKLAKEIIDRDIREDERDDREKALKARVQELAIKLQKLENEKTFQDQKDKEKHEREAAEKEMLEKEKAKKVNIKVKSY
jgi:hypothetical protein